MILMECCCHSANWQSLINAMPCLIKWLLVIVALIFLMKYLAQLLELCTKNCHESKMKEKSFEHEKWWHFQKRLEVDFKKELEDRISKLEKELGQEKASREDKLKQERLQFEHDYYKKLLDDFYGKRDENK